jgi:hypothetical protein
VYGQRPMLLPAALDKEYKRPAKSLDRVPGENHELNWVAAAKSGKPAVSNFEYAAHLNEICLLGNLAKRMDARLDWDGPNLKVTNLPEANKFVRAEYRPGWSL